MKRNLFTFVSLFGSLLAFSQQEKALEKKDTIVVLDPVEVRATRAGENAPFTKTNLSKKEIEKMNLGQDIPFILNRTPSVVVGSDAGNGIGYTGIRIRGTDVTRINVTINGIPLNDPESQGVWFVNLPDFTSSVGSIQIQRGVGTSTNGAGAFGATINISTNEVNAAPYTEFNNSYGSFNSWKNTLKVGTGLIGGHFTTDLRLSRISSDGYIDRASSDMKSFFFSSAYINKKSSLRFNLFSGKEKTYQAWYGVSEADLKTNRTINSAGTEKPGEPYNNETDNYTQTHYQLFFNHQFTPKLTFSSAVFFIQGEGFFEQYKANQKYSKYGLTEPVIGGVTIKRSDMIRRLWLDNDFYGNIVYLQYKSKISQYTLGGGWTQYDGRHFGEVIAANGLVLPARWYNLDAGKTDLNFYFKQQTRFAKHWHFFYDLQLRNVNYDINGFRDNPTLFVKNDYTFFNPKIGINFSKNGWQGYLSHSIGNKEPNRNDFRTGTLFQPKPERLYNIEMGIEKRTSKYQFAATLYHMNYKDQLVLTGKINDVGAYTRTNIPDSYRMGIELQGSASLTTWMKAIANLTFSRNKVKNFTEYIDDYDLGGQKINNYTITDIAYSPAVIGGAGFTFLPVKNLELNLFGKYAGKQFLDNTQNESRKLNAFYVQDASAVYTVKKGWMKEANIILQANNIFNKKYEPNGYTFSYISGGALTIKNFYYPMAGTNFMIALNVKL